MVFDWNTSEFRNLLEIDEEPERPANLPDPRGVGLMIHRKICADHVVEIVTRRSRKGFTVYLNIFPTCWFSKK